jgi:hypothetical protein
LVLLVIALLEVGAQRSSTCATSPAMCCSRGFCGLARIPSDCTVMKCLKQFTQASVRALAWVNRELLYGQIQQLDLRRLTIDVDGSVLRTGGVSVQVTIALRRVRVAIARSLLKTRRTLR